jgi:putative ABC transport system permease protein
MSMIAIFGAFELGLAYALLALGIYISFRILNIPDLTVDGSFVLGSAVSAVLVCQNHPILGIVMAVIAGAIAGSLTALLQTKLGIAPILSGILTMTGLYSINLLVMGGKANIPMLGKNTVFTMSQTVFGDTYYKIIVLIFIVLVVYVFYNLFFKTQLGLSIRATGDNEAMVRASSIDTDAAKIIAFALSNATVALSGAIIAQMQEFADVNMGAGMVVIGLASLIIGSVIIKDRNISLGLLSVIVGAIVYRFLIAIILGMSLPSAYLKLISALVVAVAIAIPTIKKKHAIAVMKRKGRKLC